MTNPLFEPLLGRRFMKMNGLGNDFVILDARKDPPALDPDLIRAISDRREGIGCDQVIAITPGGGTGADAGMRIWNSDGGEVEACGNAARCVAWLLMDETGGEAASLSTPGGRLEAKKTGALSVSVDMGEARFDWAAIPLSEARDTAGITLPEADAYDLGPGRAVNVGNPHIVFEVEDAQSAPVRTAGPAIETASLFPNRINVGFAEVIANDVVRLRVWERGAGLTKACGTGAVAAVAALNRAGRVGRWAQVRLDGGTLEIYRASGGRMIMTGDVAFDGFGTFGRDGLE